ncbi:hypothetical protein HC031_19555 [Planosporangium thailandense]|uniref:Uncharacterized protein n=1 Tax=Planosporangium thailandense TaxID=765197 RepID=A0ABX0Y0N0_9ACTN|nr:hypothetical protein [Planosporangium thailandense]NJC71897.1 hypothetical protein [Planosporangium thailandense]
MVDQDPLRTLHATHLRRREDFGRVAANTVPVRHDLYIANSAEEAAARIEPFVNGRSRTYLKWVWAVGDVGATAMRDERIGKSTEALSHGFCSTRRRASRTG